MSRAFGLSKSRIAAFQQCPRRLWLQVHRLDLISYDEEAQARFASGHAVGDCACALVPNGILVEAEPNLAAAITRTAELIAAGNQPIFEATFVHDGVLVRVDIMTPQVREDGTVWHVAEVKSSTAPKLPHFGDLATQLWVLQQCEVPVASTVIRHIDRTFTLLSEGDYVGLFTDADLMEDAQLLADGYPDMVSEAWMILAGDEPDIARGGQCSKPYDCEFDGWCGRDEPPRPQWPISELPHNGRALAVKWAQQGSFDIRDLPQDAPLSPVQAIVRRAVLMDQPFRDRVGAATATQDWAYPRIWLDFETISFVIPRWVGTRSYQQIPFQFSAHVEEEDGTVTHVAWLSLDGTDPRQGISEALTGLPKAGTVIAYNAGFEKGCLKDLAEAVPEYAVALTSLAARTVDLLPVTRKNYYHRDQRGSWSLKAVLAAIAPELDYGTLAVSNGMEAQYAYLEAIDATCTPERRQQIDDELSEYCTRDTLAMMRILETLLAPTNKFMAQPGDFVILPSVDQT